MDLSTILITVFAVSVIVIFVISRVKAFRVMRRFAKYEANKPKATIKPDYEMPTRDFLAERNKIGDMIGSKRNNLD